MGNYKRPRELTWVSGGMMLIITLGFGLSVSSALDTVELLATTVVTSIPTAFPVVGDSLRGCSGEEIRDRRHTARFLPYMYILRRFSCSLWRCI